MALGLPGIGLTMLAAGSLSPTVIVAAVLTLGLCMGAEGDVLAYLVMKYFELDVYSTVLGLVLGAVALSIASNTKDMSGLERYSALARGAPTDKIQIVASSKSSRFEVLEGPPTDAVVILRFPEMSDALEWYRSDAYQKALPHRLAVADYRTLIVEGP
jgi:uncharacterized protein (DUF1330 family)